MNKWMVVPYCVSQNKSENEFLKIIKQPEQQIQNRTNKQVIKEEPSENEVNETNAWQEDSYITAFKDEKSFNEKEDDPINEPINEPSYLEEPEDFMSRLRQFPARVNEKNITKRKKKKKRNLADYLQRTELITPARPPGLYDTKKKKKPNLNTTDMNPYRINFETYDGFY